MDTAGVGALIPWPAGLGEMRVQMRKMLWVGEGARKGCRSVKGF